MQVDALREQVRRAFAKVSYPASIRDALAEPYSRGSEDPYDMAAAFHGKKWEDIEIRELFRHREMLFALSPSGFAAYLPAYLIATLADEDPYDKYGADLRFYLLESLASRSDDSELRKTTEAARLAALTKPQLEATIEIVKYAQRRWNTRNAQETLDALQARG